jgi:hypothetical protein
MTASIRRLAYSAAGQGREQPGARGPWTPRHCQVFSRRDSNNGREPSAGLKPRYSVRDLFPRLFPSPALSSGELPLGGALQVRKPLKGVSRRQ